MSLTAGENGSDEYIAKADLEVSFNFFFQIFFFLFQTVV